MYWPATPPPPPPSPASRAWAIAALVSAIVGVAIGVLVAVVFGGYALLTILTGAPGHVQLTVFHYGLQIALPVVGLPSLAALAGAVVALATRPAALRDPRVKDGRGQALTALWMAISCLVLLALALPLLSVDPCWTLTCDAST